MSCRCALKQTVSPPVRRMKNNTLTTVEWLAQARRFLDENPGRRGGLSFAEANLSTQVLLAQVLERPRTWILAHPEAAIPAEAAEKLNGLLERLARGEPLPYLMGHWEFFGLDFLINQAVLIPRPETELLVEQALEWLQKHPESQSAADAGTGSGCIAVCLAKHTPLLRITAVDSSQEALEVARQNATRHAVGNQITFLQGNLLEAVVGPFDLVCANLPYIPSAALPDLAVADHEPRQALDGGEDGLKAIRALVADAPRWLTSGGLMLLEMQFNQGDEITNIVRAHLPDAAITVLPDMAGQPRLVRVERF